MIWKKLHLLYLLRPRPIFCDKYRRHTPFAKTGTDTPSVLILMKTEIL